MARPRSSAGTPFQQPCHGAAQVLHTAKTQKPTNRARPHSSSIMNVAGHTLLQFLRVEKNGLRVSHGERVQATQTLPALQCSC